MEGETPYMVTEVGVANRTVRDHKTSSERECVVPYSVDEWTRLFLGDLIRMCLQS